MTGGETGAMHLKAKRRQGTSATPEAKKAWNILSSEPLEIARPCLHLS